MKYLFFYFLLLTVGHSSFGQVDSLKKYSYFIYGLEFYDSAELSTGGCTGFFIKRNSSTYFITARHSLTGCHDNLSQATKPINKINIWISGNDIVSGIKFPMGIKQLKDTSLCPPLEEKLDAIAIKMPPLKIFDSIYSVEEFIDTTFKNTKGVYVFGYPASKTNFSASKPIPTLLELKPKTYKIYTSTQYKDTKKIDSINYMIYPKKWLFGDLHGYSGSPVFIMNQDTKKFNLIGVLCAGTERIVVAKLNLIEFK